MMRVSPPPPNVESILHEIFWFVMYFFVRSRGVSNISGMLLSFVICGVVSSLVSLSLMPRDVYSCGASGAVFGLFSVCVLGKVT